MDTINITPLFILRGESDYSPDLWEEIEIYPQDLANAQVGTTWEAINPSNIGRASLNERLTVIYKDHDTVVVKYEAWGGDDSPEANPWERKKIVVITFCDDCPTEEYKIPAP